MQSNAGSCPYSLPTVQDFLAAWQSTLSRSGLPNVPGSLPATMPVVDPRRLTPPGSLGFNLTTHTYADDKQWLARGVARTLPSCSSFQQSVVQHRTSKSPGQRKAGPPWRELVNQVSYSAPHFRGQGFNPELIQFITLMRSLQSFGPPTPSSNGAPLPLTRNGLSSDLPYSSSPTIKQPLPCRRFSEGSPSLPTLPDYQKASDDVVQSSKEVLSGLTNTRQIEAYESFVQHLYNQTVVTGGGGLNPSAVKYGLGIDVEKAINPIGPLRRNDRQRATMSAGSGGRSQNGISNALVMQARCPSVATTGRQNTPCPVRPIGLDPVDYPPHLSACWPSVAGRRVHSSQPEKLEARRDQSYSRQTSPRMVLLSTGELTPIEKLNIVDFVNSAVTRDDQGNVPMFLAQRTAQEMCWGKLNQIRPMPQNLTREALFPVCRLTFSMPSKRHRLTVGCGEKNKQQNMARILWPQFGIKSFRVNKKLGVDIPVGQPLFVHGSGWSSLDPFTTWSHLQLRARQLTVDDICLVLVRSRVESSVKAKIMEQLDEVGGASLPVGQEPLSGVGHLPLFSHEDRQAEGNVCQSHEVNQASCQATPSTGCRRQGTDADVDIKVSADCSGIPVKRSRVMGPPTAESNSPTVSNLMKPECLDRDSCHPDKVVAKWQAFSASHLAQSSYSR